MACVVPEQKKSPVTPERSLSSDFDSTIAVDLTLYANPLRMLGTHGMGVKVDRNQHKPPKAEVEKMLKENNGVVIAADLTKYGCPLDH